jgi:hypothetical protein
MCLLIDKQYLNAFLSRLLNIILSSFLDDSFCIFHIRNQEDDKGQKLGKAFDTKMARTAINLECNSFSGLCAESGDKVHTHCLKSCDNTLESSPPFCRLLLLEGIVFPCVQN